MEYIACFVFGFVAGIAICWAVTKGLIDGLKERERKALNDVNRLRAAILNERRWNAKGG